MYIIVIQKNYFLKPLGGHIMISEKIELLGAGIYTDIPSELTIKSIPTVSELDYVGSEDFQAVMLDKILPKAVEENINFRKLLEIDFHWICRCLRFLNYGPYHTVNRIYCGECGSMSSGEYSVDLRSIGCNPLPEGFSNQITISRDEFIEFGGDIVLSLPTIQDTINAYKDKAFMDQKGKVNKEYARICYMIKSFKGETNLSPISIKFKVEQELCPADYIILKQKVEELTDFGLRAGGSTVCPKCGSTNAAFVALVDDRFLRPTVGDLRRWRDDKRQRGAEDTAGNKKAAVREHN